MLKKVLIALAVVVAVFISVVALQPSDYRVVRETAISAPAGTVFAQINNFHHWEVWSPWAKLDPAAKYTFGGPTEGQGAVYAWSGNSKVGEGRMTVMESRSNELVRIRLEFIKPFAQACTTEFHLSPHGDQTDVTWKMAGQNNFLGKVFCLFMNMDQMVGGDFERGLAQMKAVAETATKPEARAMPE